MQTNWQQIDDWTAAYDNRAAVPDHEAFFTGWQHSAAEFSKSCKPQLLSYGDTEREKIDLFHPEGGSRGLCVFIHGGWWSFFGREYFSHLAAGALKHGWSVAMPSYTLCPDITIGGITEQMVRATGAACAASPHGPLVISGHSAGGHLATMMGAAETGLQSAVTDRLKRIVSISGIADLRPLIKVQMNKILKIDDREARNYSPVFTTQAGHYDYVAFAGGDELAEFRRQNALLADSRGGHIASRRIEAEGRNHFTVIDLLTDPDSQLTKLVTLR